MPKIPDGVFQAHHLDPDFYERYYRPDALADSHRRHQDRWP